MTLSVMKHGLKQQGIRVTDQWSLHSATTLPFGDGGSERVIMQLFYCYMYN